MNICTTQIAQRNHGCHLTICQEETVGGSSRLPSLILQGIQSLHQWLTGGTAWEVLRDEMPKITRAEEKAGAKIAWELIYKWELL